MGGGQLGLMMIEAAHKIGLSVTVFADSRSCPAFKICDDFIESSFTDMDTLSKFREQCDVFTVETENIHKDFLRIIEKRKNLFPSSNVIEISQNRLVEKNFLNSLKNIETTRFFEVNNIKDLKDSAKNLNYNCILKTQEFGYDGKGQSTVKKENLCQFENQILQNCIIEEKVNFKLEISVIVARNSSNMIVYPPVKNIHKESILRETIFPVKIDNHLKQSAIEKAIYISENLDLNGVLAVEMFITNDDQILINELAPRPHNSGHWTQNGCTVDQFEQHIRAIAGWNLGNGERHCDVIMENLIGDEINKTNDLIADGSVSLHLYGKVDIKPGRKMGHFNRIIK